MISLLRVFVPTGALALLFSEVLLIASGFLVLTILVLNVDPSVFLFSDNGLACIAIVTASMLFGLFFEDLYTSIHVKSKVLLAQQLSLVVGIALLIQGFISYVNDGFRMPLRVMIPGSVLVLGALFIWRIVYSIFVLRVVGAQRILFVGASPQLAEMAAHIVDHPDLGMDILGYVDNNVQASHPGGKLLGPLSDLPAIAEAVKPDRLVVGLAERRGQMPIAGLLELRYGGLAIEEASTACEQLFGRLQLSDLRPGQMTFSPSWRLRRDGLIYQTLANWLLALLLLVLTAPLLLLAAVLLKLSARGPLLSRYECIGQGGKPFRLYGLRLPEEARRSTTQHFIRRWRFHALPRLWNVLRGEIAFVGPRAERTEFAAILMGLIPFYQQLFRVKPGITGWAQINMPQDRQEDTLLRLEYDFYYLKNVSRGLDSYILIHTLRELFIARAPI